MKHILSALLGAATVAASIPTAAKEPLSVELQQTSLSVASRPIVPPPKAAVAISSDLNFRASASDEDRAIISMGEGSGITPVDSDSHASSTASLVSRQLVGPVRGAEADPVITDLPAISGRSVGPAPGAEAGPVLTDLPEIPGRLIEPVVPITPANPLITGLPIVSGQLIPSINAEILPFGSDMPSDHHHHHRPALVTLATPSHVPQAPASRPATTFKLVRRAWCDGLVDDCAAKYGLPRDDCKNWACLRYKCFYEVCPE